MTMEGLRAHPVWKTRLPTVILLDIEGTTTDVSFVSRVLFPFLKANIGRFLYETYDQTVTKELIQRMRASSQQYPELGVIPTSGDKTTIVRAVTSFALASLAAKRRISEMKQLQLLVWVWGYQKGLLKGHVYDEVTTCMHIWKYTHSIHIYILSSGMIAAQKLLLCCTNHGNCLPLIQGFFDSGVGEKTSIQCYENIARRVGVENLKNYIFITDSPKEAMAAIDAGMRACIIKRPNCRIPELDKYEDVIPIVTSFEDLHFEK